MARCEAARRKCEAAQPRVYPDGPRLSVEDFHIGYNPQLPNDKQWKPWTLWYVGFYEPDQGKHTANGATFMEALGGWLLTYEHQWDPDT